MWFALQIIIQLLRNHYLVGHFDWDRWKFASMIVAMQHSGAARWLNESRGGLYVTADFLLGGKKYR